LYDKEAKIEIRNWPEKVRLVFIEYKKWFNDGRYSWPRGKKLVFQKMMN
jgi:hypothetical protein